MGPKLTKVGLESERLYQRPEEATILLQIRVGEVYLMVFINEYQPSCLINPPYFDHLQLLIYITNTLVYLF